MGDKQARFLRRLAARRQAADPAGTREQDDRRQERRRADPPLKGAALNARLRELGIYGDRRQKGRRTGGDRRRI